MANKIVEELISELSDTQKEAMFELQNGLPESDVNMSTVASLDERDLVNRIQFTSTRSTTAVPGWALSERGNQVVEAMKRRQQYDAEVESKPKPKASPAVVKSNKKEK